MPLAQPLVLIIIDEPALRDLFSINLKVRGFDVLDIRSNSKIMASVVNNLPQLVILDLMVGEVDGFDICNQLCKSNLSPVIAFNMRGGDADLLKCLEMGVDDYIGKPFGVDELMARINAVLRHKRFDRQREENKSIEWSKI
jgi:two-component system KDP operon response regulator KdpE